MRLDNELRSTTGCPIQRKGCRVRICPSPGSIEANGGRATAGGQRTIVAQALDCHLAALLREGTIPALRDLLTIREGKLQGPAVDRRRTGIGDNHTRRETTRPLALDRIVHLTNSP